MQSDKDTNYSYGDMRKSDKNVPYKIDKSSGATSLRGRQNDMAHFSSGRSITYDRSSADRILRVTKKVVSIRLKRTCTLNDLAYVSGNKISKYFDFFTCRPTSSNIFYNN